MGLPHLFPNAFRAPTPPMPDMPDMATPPSMADPSIAAIGARARARLAALGGMGLGGTIKSAPQGAANPAVTKAMLSAGSPTGNPASG